MTDDQSIRRSDGTHDSSTTELFSTLQCGADVWHTYVNDSMALVTWSAPPHRGSRPIVGGDWVLDSVLVRCGDLFGRWRGRRKAPPEQL